MKTIVFNLTKRAKENLEANCRHLETASEAGGNCDGFRNARKLCKACGKVIEWSYA